MEKAKLLVLTVCFVAQGCAATATVNYSQPRENMIENSAIFERPFDQTWDVLVRNLAKEFFVINNIDKESRIINVSFSAQDPEEFVNCGNTSREYISPSGNKRSYYYAVADDSEFMYADQQGFPWLINRRTSLDGRANIYLAPKGEKTEMSVNVRYILDVKVRSQGFNKYEKPVPGAVYNDTHSWTFETKQPYRGTGPDPVCTTRGVLEQRLLSAVHG